MKKIYLLYTALSSSLVIQALAVEPNAIEGQTQSLNSLDESAGAQSNDQSVKDLTDQLTVINKQQHEDEAAVSPGLPNNSDQPIIDTKDHYTLEKQPLVETKDHYTLEKKKDPNVMTTQGTGSNSGDGYTADTVKNIDLSYEGDHQKLQLNQIDDSVYQEKKMDTSILEHLAQSVTNMDSDRLRHPDDIINTCNSYSQTLVSFGTEVHRFFGGASIDNTYASKRHEFDSYCKAVQERLNAIQSAPLNDIDGLRSSIAIDASYELKKKIEDIINYVQQL